MKRTAATLLLSCGLALPGLAQKVSLAFKPAGSNEFTFNTGWLKGKLRPNGASNGLSEVEHLPSGTRLDSSLGLFGYYRIFSANKRYGNAAWFWPSTAALNRDGSVSVRWPAAEDHPFELGATYRFSAPDTLDLEATFKSDKPFKDVEVFLASYFTAGFTNASVFSKGAGKSDQAGFTVASADLGNWLVFPRDAEAFRLVRDGRWKYPPSPVEWVHAGEYARPLGVRRDVAANLAAIVMAPRSDCYAVLTPFESEKHYSTYLALFGRDAGPGRTLKARARLVITTNISDSAAIQLYKKLTKK